MSHTPSKEELQSALEQYDTLLIQRVETGQAKGAKDLHDLDGQLWSKMSLALRESNAPSVNLAELKEVMRYKLAVSVCFGMRSICVFSGLTVSVREVNFARLFHL